MELTSLALTGGPFTTSATWEAIERNRFDEIIWLGKSVGFLDHAVRGSCPWISPPFHFSGHSPLLFLSKVPLCVQALFMHCVDFVSVQPGACTYGHQWMVHLRRGVRSPSGAP